MRDNNININIQTEKHKKNENEKSHKDSGLSKFSMVIGIIVGLITLFMVVYNYLFTDSTPNRTTKIDSVR